MAHTQEEEIQDCDSFRTVENMSLADDRKLFIFNSPSLKDWREHINASISSTQNVPTKVRIQIETVKNLFLYSWHVYRFGVVAHTQMINALELALDEKFELTNNKRLNGLSRKLEKAFAQKWFNQSAMSHLPSPPKTKEDTLIILGAISSIRNELNHGTDMLLDPASMLESSIICVKIIDALFEDN